jgi:ribonuclease D
MTPAEGDVPGLPADLPDPAVAPDLPEAPAGPGDAEAPAAVDPDAATQAPEVPLLTIRGGLPPVVADAAGVAELVARFRSGSGPVAVDAERASGYRYSQRAYLIQLRREGVGSVLIDPIPLGSVPNVALAPLSRALADTEWIIHAASQDLACLAEVGMRPVQLFDTELAGRLLNYPRVGLAALVEELLGYRMRKEHSAVDWSRRPLPESWLTYAALDVEPLIELREILAAQLEEAGKAEWAAQEFQAWVSMPAVPPRIDPWRRTSGIHRVKGRRGLAMVRAMWQLRADIARKRDVTTNRILNDATIVEAAQAAPASRHALGQVTGFATRGGQRYLREFHSAIAAARSLPEEDLPPLAAEHDGPPPPRTWGDRNPEAAARLAACRESVSSLAESLNLPQENLVSPSTVRRLAWSPPRPVTAQAVADRLTENGARPWQVALAAEPLAMALRTAAD